MSLKSPLRLNMVTARKRDELMCDFAFRHAGKEPR
jgi:hypothetical protein